MAYYVVPQHLKLPRRPLLERLTGKCSGGVMVAYAPLHGEQEIPEREEQYMDRIFDEEYLSYKTSVRRWV